MASTSSSRGASPRRGLVRVTRSSSLASPPAPERGAPPRDTRIAWRTCGVWCTAVPHALAASRRLAQCWRVGPVAGEYRVNGKAVKAGVYHEQLKALGILTKAHLGFLVFQAMTPLAHSPPHAAAPSRTPTPRAALWPAPHRSQHAPSTRSTPLPRRATSRSWPPSRRWSSRPSLSRRGATAPTHRRTTARARRSKDALRAVTGRSPPRAARRSARRCLAPPLPRSLLPSPLFPRSSPLAPPAHRASLLRRSWRR